MKKDYTLEAVIIFVVIFMAISVYIELRNKPEEEEKKEAPQEVTIKITIESDEDLQHLKELMQDWLEEWQVDKFESTGYAPLDPQAAVGMCHDGDPTTTRTGTFPSHGTVAVDPELIPLGEPLWVEGYGWATAEDTGGAVTGRTVDLFFPTIRQANRWGRENVTVVRRR